MSSLKEEGACQEWRFGPFQESRHLCSPKASRSCKCTLKQGGRGDDSNLVEGDPVHGNAMIGRLPNHSFSDLLRRIPGVAISPRPRGVELATPDSLR